MVKSILHAIWSALSWAARAWANDIRRRPTLKGDDFRGVGKTLATLYPAELRTAHKLREMVEGRLFVSRDRRS